MYKRILSFLPLLLLVCGLAGQYDEKAILNQQAYQMLAQRQFGEVEKLFNQILQKYPDDVNSVLQLLNLHFQTSQVDKAEATLNQYRRILPQTQLTEQEILLLLMQGKPDPAWEKSQSYLQQQGYNEGKYRLIASFFERRGFLNQVIRLYQEARVKLKNPELFRLEIANAALTYRLFDQALQEYITFLDKNPGNLYFINNQCRTILTEDSTRIAVIGNLALHSDSVILKELYANALVYLKQYPQALEIYKSLPVDKLIRFAEEQYSALNDEVCLPAFQFLAQISTDTMAKNDYLLRMAMIFYRNRDYPQTDNLLNQIFADSLMLDRSNIQRKGVNLIARKLMAENTLALSKDIQAAQKWYTAAKSFCNNSYDLQDIELAQVRLLLIQKEYDLANELLISVSDPLHTELRNYLQFSIELMRGNTAKADTLMNDYIIHYPSGKYVNDAIFQMMFVLSLSPLEQIHFFDASRLMLLQDLAAVDSLAGIFQRTQDEEILILAIEWSIVLSDESKALNLLNYEWKDEISVEYALLLKLMLTDDINTEQRMARDFLKSSPNSIFAPKFRSYLSLMNFSRPQY